ncbi:type II CAAX endopeptidase family protein [Streptomyces sp. NPDC006296]|uniref:CPBP family intramembrane glutamic endopeptidase n=1 Tax=Streptomyces sp. NPDC006296 TaxID=3156746 RepID=UPI0033A2111C
MQANHLVHGQDLAQRRVGPLSSVLVAAVCLAVGQFVGWLTLRGTGFDGDSPAGQIVACLAGFTPTLALLALWVTVLERRPFSTLGFRPDGRLRKAVLGAITAVGFLLLLSAAGNAVRTGSGEGEGGSSSVALGGGLLLLTAYLVQASTEEIVFRGFLLPKLTARRGAAVGVLGSSALFACAHMINRNAPMTYIAMTLLLGIALALWALADGALWRTCAFHSVWNWLPNFLNAGSEGSPAESTTETTIVSLLVLAVVVLAALWSYRRSLRSDRWPDLREEQSDTGNNLGAT